MFDSFPSRRDTECTGCFVTHFKFPGYFGDQLSRAKLCCWFLGTSSVFLVLLKGDEELGAPNPINALSDFFSELVVCSVEFLAP